MFILRLIVPLLLLLLPVEMHAQNCRELIRGIVTDAGSGEALPEATVLLDSGAFVMKTDLNGEFRFDGLCSRKYRIEVRYLGYAVYGLTVNAGNAGYLQLRIKPEGKKIKQMEIVGERIKDQQMLSADTIGKRELERNAGSSLTDHLRQISGVTGIQTGPSIVKPVIHGLHSQRVLILNAGVRQEGQQWGTEHAPEIDPFIAGRLTVIKGASSVRYGADAIGGVVLVEPRDLPHEPGLNAELSMVANTNGRQGIISALVEQHLGRFHDLCWRVQGTVKRSGNLNTPDYYLQNTALNEYNFSASLGLERKRWGSEIFYSQFNTRIGIFTGSHIGNLSDLVRVIQNGEVRTNDEFSMEIQRPRQEVTHRLLSWKSWLTITNIGKLNFQYGYQFNHRFEYDLDRFYNDSLNELRQPELELRLYTHTADLNVETKNTLGFTAVAGVSLVVQDNQYGGSRFFVPNYQLASSGLYSLLRWKKSAWEVEAGARIENRTQRVFRNLNGSIVETPYQFVNPSFTAGVLYKQSESSSWKLNAATAFRPPSINEWFSNGLHHGTATYETGDSTLGVEKAWNLSLSYIHQREKMSLDVTGYYMFIRDYIYLVPSLEPVLTISGAFPAFQYKHVDAGFWGVDVTLDYDLLKRLNLRSRNQAVWAWNYTNRRYLELVPSPRFEQVVSWRFKDRKKWKDASFGVSNLTVLEQTRFAEGTDYIPPPPAYTLFGAEAAVTYIGDNIELRMRIQVSNAFNTSYREYLNRFRYYADELGRNIRLQCIIPLAFRTKPHDHPH